jgi:hypothetical protein
LAIIGSIIQRDRREETGHRREETGHRREETGHRREEQATGEKRQATEEKNAGLLCLFFPREAPVHARRG